MNKGILSGFGLLLVVVLFLALNLYSANALSGSRVDLTEAKLYTLTDGSRNILRGIDEPISLKLYFSESMASDVPFLKTYATRVRELLDEYVAASGGKLALTTIDPAPFSEEEDDAVAAGLQGLPLPPANELAYFGLVATNAVDETEVIPFFDPSKEEFLEYDISRFIYTLSSPDKPTVGLLSSLPIDGGPAPGANPFAPEPPAEPWFVVEQIRELFEVEVLAPDASEVPEDVDVLMLVHPKGLSQAMLYAIDQFVLGGGRLLAFVDPHCEADTPPTDPNNPLAGMQIPRSSDLGPLLAAWGVGYDSNSVVGDRPNARTVTMGSQGRPEQVAYVAWVNLGKDAFAADDPVTAGLEVINLAAAGALVPLEGASTTFTPLVQSSPESSLVTAESLRMFPDPKRMLADFVPDDEAKVLAARLHGQAASAFPDGAPPEPPDPETEGDEEGEEPETEDATAEHLTASDDIHVVLVADADMLADRWWVAFQNLLGMRLAVPQANNADLVINTLESLGGSTDLIGVRSRGRFERPFERIEALELEAQQKFLEKEQMLQQRLQATERRLNELQSQREEGSSMMLTEEQAAEIEQFQQERITTRKELRAVQLDLRKDIDSLKTWLKAGNVLGVPLLLALLAAGSWLIRRS